MIYLIYIFSDKEPEEVPEMDEAKINTNTLPNAFGNQ